MYKKSIKEFLFKIWTMDDCTGRLLADGRLSTANLSYAKSYFHLYTSFLPGLLPLSPDPLEFIVQGITSSQSAIRTTKILSATSNGLSRGLTIQTS